MFMAISTLSLLRAGNCSTYSNALGRVASRDIRVHSGSLGRRKNRAHKQILFLRREGGKREGRWRVPDRNGDAKNLEGGGCSDIIATGHEALNKLDGVIREGPIAKALKRAIEDKGRDALVLEIDGMIVDGRCAEALKRAIEETPEGVGNG